MLHPWPQFSLLERNVWLNNESVTSWLSDRQRVIQILLILSPTRLGSKIGATRKFWVVSEGGSSSTLIYLVEVGFLYTSHQTTFRSSKEAHSKCRISAKEVHGQYIKSCASVKEAQFLSAALTDLEKWHRTVIRVASYTLTKNILNSPVIAFGIFPYELKRKNHLLPPFNPHYCIIKTSNIDFLKV